MRLGFIGLGKMGSRIVVKLLEEGHEVVVWNRTGGKISNFQSQISNFKYRDSLQVGGSIEDLVKKLDRPRIVWSMLPAGEATEEILNEVGKFVETGDVVIDSGNSHFSDTQKRFEQFEERGIRFLGIGVSGGLIAAKEGYPLMVGGKKSAYIEIKPILNSLSKPNGGHEYFGEGGAGHFVKMVHNGIEYGYMQSIGEGFGVLEKSPYDLDLVKVAKLYQKGSLVAGFMMQRTIEVFENDRSLLSVEGYIDSSGEGQWTVEEGKKQDVPVDVIEKSLEFRERSKSNVKVSASFAARMVAALRNAFGGHEVRKKTND